MEEKDKEIKASVERAGSKINKAIYDRQKQVTIEGLGLCKDCENLEAYETRYGSVTANCGTFKGRLNPADPVKICSCYWSKSTQKITELIGLAWFIDLKRPIGFIQDDLWPMDNE